MDTVINLIIVLLGIIMISWIILAIIVLSIFVAEKIAEKIAERSNLSEPLENIIKIVFTIMVLGIVIIIFKFII